MKIALFGATGNIGKRILKEALQRGHFVTAIVRDPSKLTSVSQSMHVVKGDVTDPASVASTVTGHDVVISSVQGGLDSEGAKMIIHATRSIIEGLKKARVKRLLVVGGAGSLEIAPGRQLVDAPNFPPEYKPVALAHREALSIYRAEKELEWTYQSPAMMIQPGNRTGKFRIGHDQLVKDEADNSIISMEDFAVAMLNEIETPKFIRKRFTLAY